MHTEEATLSSTRFNGEREKEEEEKKREILNRLGLPPIRKGGVIGKKAKVDAHTHTHKHKRTHTHTHTNTKL